MRLYARSKQWRAQKLFQGVSDPVKEFEDEERLDLGAGWGKKEQTILYDGEQDRRRLE